MEKEEDVGRRKKGGCRAEKEEDVWRRKRRNRIKKAEKR